MNRYENIKRLRDDNGKAYIANPIYPTTEPTGQDVYFITKQGDRFDKMAQEFFSDSSLWWVIASENPHAYQGGIVPKLGVQIRIPANVSSTLQNYNNINNTL